MNDFNFLGNENVSKVRHRTDNGGKNGLVVEGHDGKVVDLQEVGHVPDADPVAVGVSDDNDLVALFHQTLGQLVQVRLDAAGVGIKKV